MSFYVYGTLFGISVWNKDLELNWIASIFKTSESISAQFGYIIEQNTLYTPVPFKEWTFINSTYCGW